MHNGQRGKGASAPRGADKELKSVPHMSGDSSSPAGQSAMPSQTSDRDIQRPCWQLNSPPEHATEHVHVKKPATQRVQALADISRSALYAFAMYKAISLHT